MKIHFYLRFHTEFGQQLQVTSNWVGAGSELKEVMQMNHLNNEFWHLTVDVSGIAANQFQYAYQLVTRDGEFVKEWGGRQDNSTTG